MNAEVRMAHNTDGGWERFCHGAPFGACMVGSFAQGSVDLFMKGFAWEVHSALVKIEAGFFAGSGFCLVLLLWTG